MMNEIDRAVVDGAITFCHWTECNLQYRPFRAKKEHSVGFELWIVIALVVAAFGAAYLLPVILFALLAEQRTLAQRSSDGLSTAPGFPCPSSHSSVPLVPTPLRRPLGRAHI